MNTHRFFKVSVAVILITAMLSISPLSVLGSSLQLTVNAKTSEELRKVCNFTGINEQIEVGIFLNDLSDEEVATAFESQQVTRLDSLTVSKESFSSKPTSDQINNTIANSRNLYKSLYNQHNQKIAEDLSISSNIIYRSRYSPLIIASLTKSEINRLALTDKVTYIDTYSRDVKAESTSDNGNDFNIDLQICRINEAKQAFDVDGSGVVIGIVDEGIPNETELAGYSIPYIPSHMYGSYKSSHASYCANIINTIAPGSTLFFAGNPPAGGVVECVEWLLDQEVMIISASISAGIEANTYTMYSKWFDHISYHHAVIFVTAAGNNDVPNELQGCRDMQMAYNVITVGSLNCKTTLTYSDDELGIAHFNNTSVAPFKPDISTSCGDTSGSTALMTGSIALLLETDTSLRMYSETIKALLAASVNQSSPHKYCTSDRTESRASFMQVGAGLLDVYRFLYNGIQEKYYNNTISNSINEDTIYFAPNCDIRLAFAYVQPVTISSIDHSFEESTVQGDIVDYAIYIRKQDEIAPITYSNTSNNLEIVEFNSGTGGYFTIKIVPVYATTSTVFYSVATNVEPAT
ncbi:MAG: S8 family serine peptidase [Clostridia bacterium]|nr:S8 family serine peptidase [Clostridia bacterium]